MNTQKSMDGMNDSIVRNENCPNSIHSHLKVVRGQCELLSANNFQNFEAMSS